MLYIFLWLALSTSVNGIISIAMDNFRNVESYTVTIDSRSDGRREVVKYFYKTPGYARMDFAEPDAGDVLVYNPVKKEARLLPRGAARPFVVTLNAENKLIKSQKGRAIAESGIGALLRKIEKLQAHGTIELLNDEKSDRGATVKVKVLGAYGYAVEGANAYILWLDKRSFFPVRVTAYDSKGSLTEDLLMSDLVLNPALPDNLFKLE